MWNTNGKTIKRNIIDQSQIVANVSNTVQTVPFQFLRTVGYLSKIYIGSPQVAGVFTIAGGTGTAQTGANFPQLKTIFRFTLNLQAIANIYDVRGVTLGMLAIVGNGNAMADSPWYASGFSVAGAAPATDQFPYNWPTRDNSLLGIGTQYMPYFQVNTASTTATVCYNMEIPISEWLIFPNTPIAQTQNSVILTDQPMEVGMLFMQNNQQNLQPQVQLAAAYGQSAENLLPVTGAATLIITNQTWFIEDEFFDVPADPNDRPTNFQSSFVVTRQEIDWPVSGQQTVVKFKAAGLLLRALYIGYNDTTFRGTLVDLTQSPLTQVAFKSGSTIIKVQETATQNAYRGFRRYAAPMPGILIHDFIYDGTVVQAVDTASLVDVRTEFSVLPATVTRISCCEQRLIPVSVSR